MTIELGDQFWKSFFCTLSKRLRGVNSYLLISEIILTCVGISANHLVQSSHIVRSLRQVNFHPNLYLPTSTKLQLQIGLMKIGECNVWECLSL